MYRNDSPANDSPIKSRHNPPSRQEISTAQSRVSALKEALEGMLTGDKPYIDLGDPLLGFLFEQLEIMHAGGFLMEPPRSYCLKEDELSLSETKMALKGVTRLEPMPKALTTESKELELALKALDVHNAKVLGKDYGFRYRRPLSEQLDYADSFVLPRAGLVGLYQFVSYLSEMRSNPAALRNKQFIIQNTEDFWRPVVRALSPLIEETPNFTLTETAHSTAAHLDSALGVRKKIVARNDETVPILGPGHQILLLTGNPKKQSLYKKAAALRPDGVLMKDFASVFPEIPRGADELAYSYTGNVLDKLQALYNMVAEIGPAPYRKALRKRGLAPEAVSILIDDQGVEVDASLFAGDEFPAIAAERWNDYRSHLPGPETKGLFSALPGSSFNGKSGDEAFVSRLFSARDRIYADLPPQDRPRIQAVQKACALLVPIGQIFECLEKGMNFEQALEAHFFTMVHAHASNSLQLHANKNDRSKDLPYFLVSDFEPDGKTQAEIPNYDSRYGIYGGIYKALSRIHGFAGRHDPKYDLAAQFAGATKVRVAHIDFNRENGTGNIFGDEQRKCKQQVIKKNRQGEVIGQREEIFDSYLQQFHKFSLTKDAFVLHETGSPAHFWKETFVLSSLAVSTQIGIGGVAGKPSLCTIGPIYRMLEKMSGDLIPQKMEYLIQAITKAEASKKGKVDQKLREALMVEEPVSPKDHPFIEIGEEDKSGRLKVVVYCSASSTSPAWKNAASNLTLDLAATGFSVLTGGGCGPDGLMVAANDGAKKRSAGMANFLAEYRMPGQGHRDFPDTHLTCVASPETERMEGVYQEADYFLIAPDIYWRIHKLQEADLEILMPGGTGSVQELSGSMVIRELFPELVAGRPFIIVNLDNVYDDLLASVPQEDFEKLNIHVCNTQEEAVQIALKTREEKGIVPPEKAFPDYQEYLRVRREFERYERGLSDPGYLPDSFQCTA